MTLVRSTDMYGSRSVRRSTTLRRASRGSVRWSTNTAERAWLARRHSTCVQPRVKQSPCDPTLPTPTADRAQRDHNPTDDRGHALMLIGLQIPDFTRPEGAATLGPALGQVARTADENGF